jgi:hypothetical protein
MRASRRATAGVAPAALALAMRQAAGAAMIPEQPAVIEPVFFVHGVADPDARAGYVAGAGEIVAVALGEGRSLWRTDIAQHPLISDGRRLAAARAVRSRANALEVAVFDAAGSGDLIVVSDPVVLPQWAVVTFAHPHAFRMSALLAGSRLRLRWQAHARYGGGAPPPPRLLRAATRQDAGAAQIDLRTGAVTQTLAEPAGAASGVRRAPLVADDLSEPWLVDTTVAQLLWEFDGNEQVLMIKTREAGSGEAQERTELLRGQGLVAQVTPDGAYLFVHCEPATSAPEPWRVFSVTTARRVATLTHDAGARAPAVVGERAFYVVGKRDGVLQRQTLRARELASNALVWELALTAQPLSEAPRPRP